MADLLDELKVFQASQRPSQAAALDFKTLLRQPRFAIAGVILLLLLAAMAIWWFDYRAKVRWARQEALPEIERLVEDINIFGEGVKPWAASELATQAAKYIPDDPLLARLWPRFARYVKIYSDPPGASVYARPYANPNADWRSLGQTPIDSIRLPVGFSRMKLEMEGFRTVDDVFNNVVFFSNVHNYTLPESRSLAEEMVLVQGGTFFLDLPGLGHLDAQRVGDFLMDRYEVTNKAYKRFVGSNGYEKQEYWKYPFVKDGTTLSWEAAMARFTDKTGRPGPATWEVGDYPEGEDDYPVTGVSWYEAAAFAEFVGKSLPTIYHWNSVALMWASSEIVPLSNLTGDGPVPVGNRQAMNRFGTYDLAGNVREWCWNESSRGGQRFILGGGWDDPGWAFNDAFARPPFDRSPTNGFRCIKYLEANENQAALAQTIELVFRDYFIEEPVSDESFALFLRQYAYDKTPLNAEIEYEREEADWIRQKITFDAAYGNERMMAYLFLPKHATPPYQTVVYFPGSTAIYSRSSETSLEFLIEFLPRDGRAVMYPIYKSTYERGDDLKSDYQNETNFYKEHVIMWVRDLSRSIDYLETRDEIDTDKLAYYGGSWGGLLGPIMLAVENRIKVAVLRGAGLVFESVLPEADPFNYLPRVKAPVLMLNGRYDFFLPVETSQRPFFERLGTPEKHKVLRRYDSGHGVPRAARIKETLAWLDRYLGPVK
jgi:formylglycine-generating enzyme required for sulfatase activity/dienelactone hydrolase